MGVQDSLHRVQWQ